MYSHCGGDSTPCITLPYPFASHPPFFNSFQYTSLYHPYILYLHRHNVLQYCWCSIILFSFPSFPKFHRVVPLLLTCSTYEFVYDYACFLCICLLWIYLPHMRENMWPLSFCAWLTSLNMMSSSCIHLPSNHMSLFLWLSKTPLCVFTIIS
jgi:hypothetical protein